jgi:hypothetical protein
MVKVIRFQKQPNCFLRLYLHLFVLHEKVTILKELKQKQKNQTGLNYSNEFYFQGQVQ